VVSANKGCVMKVIILAGGFGTRLSEFTELIPKPMVQIGPKPILWHIMEIYAKYGHKDFYVALGYKAEIIKEYFLNFYALNSDFTIDLSTGDVVSKKEQSIDWKVTLVNTGLHSMTGGRVKKMKDYVGKEPFLLTYGDGLSNVNIADLVDFHKSHGKLVTMSAVRPSARFGRIEMHENQVSLFAEKSQTSEGWINGGYFVMEPAVFDLIDGDDSPLEGALFESLSKSGNLMAYKHDGFWQCMDTKRDYEFLQSLLDSGGVPPWLSS